MNNMYIAMESLAALTILILIYANVCEVKQHTRKRKLFTRLLIVNEIVVLADTISWMHLGWDKKPVVLGVIIAITYILPILMQIIFSLYLYEHISLTQKASKRPFDFIVYYSLLEGLLTLLFCVSGKMFVIVDGKYQACELEGVFYILNIISVLLLAIIVVSNYKKMSIHDLLAALSFCFVPIISMVITVITEINVSVTLMSVSMLLMYVMLQSESENYLFRRANLDELTGLFNRRTYEEEIERCETEGVKDDFVYASIDVNGLKQVNDNLGHAAGDELICGAAECLKSALGRHGRVFRTGGDEFVAMFYADMDGFNKIKADLELVTGKWHGTAVETLSLSIGYVLRKEYPDMSLVEMGKMADTRMYDDKRRYYASKGVDRRGQNEAYKVLCSLYTKILKINITDGSYSIINMNSDEQTPEMGFASTISEWLEGFGRSGQVYPEDLDSYLASTNTDYMRNYFKSGKTSLSITYRRKFDEEYKQVMMEIIPSGEYTDDNQSLYLYVKNIDI